MKSLLSATLGAALTLFAGLAAAQAPTTATTHGDWTVRCTIRDDGSRYCEMHQDVFADEEKTKLALRAYVFEAPDGQGTAAIFKLPLGIMLIQPTEIQIDDGRAQEVEITICDRDGCRIDMRLTPDYVAALKAGGTLTVFAHDRKGVRFSVPLSLSGFTAALADMQGS